MSKYQGFKEAIEAFQPGGADAPILYATTEANEKSFKALSGRKLKLWSSRTTIVILVCALIFIAASVVSAILTRQLGGTPVPAPAVFVPMFILFLFRTTLVTIGDAGLNFYFLEIKFGKYAVSDKISLPYDKISNVKVKVGKVFKHTHLTFHFDVNGKNHKIKISISNRMKKVQEQSENLKVLTETLEKKNLYFD